MTEQERQEVLAELQIVLQKLNEIVVKLGYAESPLFSDKGHV